MAADPAFVLTATVRVAFRKEYDGGFLVLFADPDHWVKLLFEKSHYGPYSVCSNVTNGGTDDNVHHDVQGQEVRLRITRSGDLFTLLFFSRRLPLDLPAPLPVCRERRLETGLRSPVARG